MFRCALAHYRPNNGLRIESLRVDDARITISGLKGLAKFSGYVHSVVNKASCCLISAVTILFQPNFQAAIYSI